MKRIASSVELLESRIAPAAIYTWTDVDGDKVTIKSGKGTNGDLLNIMEQHRVAQGDGYRINEIDFTDVTPGSALEFSNAALSVSIVRGPHGDGRVDLGTVTSGALPLHSFLAPHASIQQLDCGDGKHAIGALQIASYGTAAPGYFNNGIDDSLGVLSGSVGSIHIAGDITYGGLQIYNPEPATTHLTVGSIYIGGNLNGLATLATAHAGELIIAPALIGSLTINGSVIGGGISSNPSPAHVGSGILDMTPLGIARSVKIGGDIIGGGGDGSGTVIISALSSSIGGSVEGGGGMNSGVLETTFLHSCSVRGSIAGSSGYGSGQIQPAGAPNATLTIGGEIRGGTNNNTGLLLASSDVNYHILVKGSVIGGQTSTAADIGPAGAIVVDSGPMGFVNARDITIGGNLVAGSVTDGSYDFNGSILISGNVQSITIRGSIVGSDLARAQILVKGQTPTQPGVSFDGIGALSVGGSAEFAIIASDHSFNGGSASVFSLGPAENPDAGIGAITIGGDLYHTSVLAGTNDNDKIGAGRLNGANQNLDTQSAGDAGRVARLGPVVIKGAILDDYSASGDSGFEAEQITSITAGGVRLFKHGDGFAFFDSNHFVFAEELPLS